MVLQSLLDVITAPTPDGFLREQGESYRDYALRKFEDMDKLLQENADQVCAVIVEPLVQCAGNMRMYEGCHSAPIPA